MRLKSNHLLRHGWIAGFMVNLQMAKRKKIPPYTQRKLFVHTGNQCAMPDCTRTLYEGAYLRQMPIPERAVFIRRGLQEEVFNLTEHSDDKLIDIAKRVISFYLRSENTYNSRVLLSNQIGTIPGVPLKVQTAILSYIRADLFNQPA
jgi:hypothetical protein